MAELPPGVRIAGSPIGRDTTGLSGLPIETGPGIGRVATGLGVDVVGGGLSAAAGYALAPVTFGLSIPVLAIGGGMASNYAAQKIEGEGFSLGRMLASGFLNLIPGAGKLAATTTGKIAGRELGQFALKEGIRGSGIAMGEKAVQTAIDEQRFPTFDEFKNSAALGAAFGGTVGLGIGVAAQKGLFNKIGGLNSKELNEKLKVEDERTAIVNGIADLAEKGDAYEGIFGSRTQFFRDGLTERVSRRTAPLSDQVYDAINQDLSNALNPADASFRLDRFINEASDEINVAVAERVYKSQTTELPRLSSINRLGGAKPFNKAKGPQAKAFKKSVMDEYEALHKQRQEQYRQKTEELADQTIATDEADRLANLVLDQDKTSVRSGFLGKASRVGQKFVNFIRPSNTIGRIATELDEKQYLSRSSDRIAINAEKAVNNAVKNAKMNVADRARLANDINEYLVNNRTLEQLPKSIRDNAGEELELYREELDSLQKKLLQYLGGEFGETLPDETRQRLMEVIAKSIRDKNFVTRSFRFYVDKGYSPSNELRQKAIDGEARRIGRETAERQARQMSGGKKPDTDLVQQIEADKDLKKLARQQAEEEMVQRDQYSAKEIQKNPDKARERAADRNEIKFQAQGILEGRGNLSDELREYLGEITDPGEKLFQTLNKTSRLVNALQTDEALISLFRRKDVQDVLRVNTADAGERILTNTAYGAELMKDVMVPREVNDALRDLFYSDVGYLTNNAVGRVVLDNLKSLNALSKISKTIYNPASYAPNFIGNFSSVMASGILPFRGLGRGMKFSLSEFEFVRKKILRGKANREDMKRMLRFEELGGGSANVMTSEIRKAGNRGLFGDLNQTIADPFSKLYNVGDTSMRYVAWEGTQRQLKKAIPALAQEGNKEALERAAMRIVRNTFQDYDKVPAFIKKLSQIGIASPFVNFTAELMRNTYNQGRYAFMMMKNPRKLMSELGLDGIDIDDQAVRGLQKLGVQRAAAFSVVMAGAGTAVEMIGSKAKDLFGDNYKNLSGEEKIALNQTVAKSWHRGKRLLYLPDANGKTGKYLDTEYIVPQTLMTSAFVSGLNDDPFEVLPKIFMDNFLGEGTFLLQASSNLFGKDQNGRDISVRPGVVGQTYDRVNAFVQAAFEPGAARELEKWNKTLRGMENSLEVRRMVERLVGLRWEEYDIERDAARRLAPDATAINNAKGLLGTSRKYDIKEQYDRNYIKLNQDREGILKKITGHYNNLKVLGLDSEQALNVLDKTALSTNDKFEGITGYYSPMPYEEPLTKTEIYESLGDTPEQRVQAIRAMRGQGVNPREIRSFMDMHKRMEKKARRGDPAMPASLMLLKKMDKEDRLKRLTDPNGPYRLTQSNRPLIRELQRLDILERDMIRYLPVGQ
jgi:hypothetical protein